MMIDFKTLLALADEIGGQNAIADTIGVLAMNDIHMSDPVIKLGIACNVLLDDYCNGWSENKI